MWFTETAIPPIAILLLVAGGFLLAWSNNNRILYLGGIVGCLLLCGVVYAIEVAIVTPREEVEESVRSIAMAAVDGDIDRTVAHVSNHAPDVSQAIRGAMTFVDVHEGLSVKDFEIKMKSSNSQAEADFRANGMFSLQGSEIEQHAATRWLFTWRKEGGQWKVTKLQRLDPMKGEPIQLMARQSN